MEFNSSYITIRHDLLKHVKGIDLDILDIGCANGENGRYLMEKGYAKSVVGVEYVDAMAIEAKKKLSIVFSGSIEDKQLLTELKSYNFDIILLGDVLEHLVDPWSVLNSLSENLKKEGKIIISTPNVQHIEVFISLYMKGSWPLNDRGIFDRTHLRWFTIKDLRKLVNQANLKIDNVERIFRFRDALNSKFPFWSLPFKKLKPSWFTHQYVITASSKL